MKLSLRGRVVRYAGVGLTLAVLYTGIVIGVMSAFPESNPTFVAIVAFVVTLIPGYVAHGSITFSDSNSDRFRFARFAMTNSWSFVVSIGGMYVITKVYGLGYLISIGLNWVLIPLFNFLVYLVWVFRHRHDESLA